MKQERTSEDVGNTEKPKESDGSGESGSAEEETMESTQNVSGELTGTGVELQTFSDKEWEKGETALSTQLLKAKKDKKGVSVFSAGTGPRRKGSYSAESEERKELQLKVNLIAQYVSDVAKLLMDDVIGREGVEVHVSILFNKEEAISI
ncbi:hypothetical protein V3C99_001071 [Haemonchus contortus]|uniref:AKAP7_NLS domain-containing protein n=1 Tax=Haemonchus contortus TaxID=6289 RepID=A0A7I4YCN7_HAECO|nr:unnamed protein product [Haemonchus contortus]